MTIIRPVWGGFSFFVRNAVIFSGEDGCSVGFVASVSTKEKSKQSSEFIKHDHSYTYK